MSVADIEAAQEWSFALIQLVGIWAALAVFILIIIACLCGYVVMPYSYLIEAEEKDFRTRRLEALKAEISNLRDLNELLERRLDAEKAVS